MIFTDAAWVVLTGTLVGASCGILGCFLILRRLAMVADAISHAVLPGIVVAFLLTQSRTSVPMFLGAAVIGVLTSIIIQALTQRGVQGDAAIGITFTALFALGVVLISTNAQQVDLDLDCVLYGEILHVPHDPLILGGKLFGPVAVWISGGLLLLNLLVLGALYKEFKLCAFDPGMAVAVGISVAAMHYLLMGLVSVTVVGAFNSVGAILVVAMIIVPAATAYLLTDRLERMLGLSVLVAFASSLFGYLLSHALDCSTAGAMASVGGLFFLLAFLFSPKHGVVSRSLSRKRLRRLVEEEDVLLWAARQEELPSTDRIALTAEAIGRSHEWLPSTAQGVLRRLSEQRLLQHNGAGHLLTEAGRRRAQDLLRRHRIYETYLGDLGYPTDHLHDAADRVEHYVPAHVTDAMDAAARYPERDPQGKPIPPPAEESGGA